MKSPALNRLGRIVLLVAAALAALPGLAQEFPNKPIRIIVGFGQGIGMEVSTRLMAELLAREIGQPVLVENKPGAATMIAASAVAGAPRDGYTLLMLNNQTVNNALMYRSVPYRNSDFIPIAAGGLVSMVMAVSKTVKVASGREFIDYAKANPDKVFYGYWGAGGSPHLLAARMAATSGVQMQGVGYKDPGQATADLVTGRIQLFFTSATHGLSLAQAGHANIVAVGTPARMANLPEVPTFVESGIEGMPNPWWGYAAPAGTPPEVVEKLARAIRAAVASPRYQAMLATTGSAVLPADTPAKFQEFIDRDQERWAAAIRPLKLQLD